MMRDVIPFSVSASRSAQRAPDAVQRDLERHTALCMPLRIEKYFGMNDTIGDGAFHIGRGEIVKILLVEQHAHSGVVQIEKRLQVGKVIRGLQVIDGGIRQIDPVAPGDFEHQLGLETAFDMQVQFSLRQTTDKII